MTSEYLGTINLKTRNSISQIFNPARYKKTITRHILNMSTMPSISFISDSVLSSVSVNEAFVLGLPSITLLDSGSVSSKLSYFVPGNSTSISSLLLYYNLFKNSIYQGLYKERYLFFLAGLKNKKIVTSNLQLFKKNRKINFFKQYGLLISDRLIQNLPLFQFYNTLMKGSLLYHTEFLTKLVSSLSTTFVPLNDLSGAAKLNDLKLNLSNILYLNTMISARAGNLKFDLLKDFLLKFRTFFYQFQNLENFNSLNFNFDLLYRRSVSLYLTTNHLITNYNVGKYLNKKILISSLPVGFKNNNLLFTRGGPNKFNFSNYYNFFRFHSR